MTELQIMGSVCFNSPNKVPTEQLIQGKTSDNQTVTLNENATFKTETFRKIHATILTDIADLNKAREVARNTEPVVWKDKRGKTGMDGIKQIFSNIKHNIRVSLMDKRQKTEIKDTELKAFNQLKTNIKKLENMLKETVIDPDLKEDCEKLYNELKGKRAGGYADTKEKLMNLIGDKDADGSLKKDVEMFLNRSINEKGEFFEVDNLKKRFCSVSSENVEQFEDLLKAYEANSDEGKLKNEIKNLFEKEWIGEVREKKCRDIDKKRDELMARIEDFFSPAQDRVEKKESAEKRRLEEAKAKEEENRALMNQVLHMKHVPKYMKDLIKKRGLKGMQGIYPGEKTETVKEETTPENTKPYKEKTFDGVGKRMNFGDYRTDFVFYDEENGTSKNIQEMAVERLKEDFKNIFPNGDEDKFESLLKTNAPEKNDTVNQLKALVTDAAKAQKENVKNEKPTSEEIAKKDEFLKELPYYLNKLPYKNSINTREVRVMKYFDGAWQGFEKTREKLESLLDARKEESDFLVFNRLQHLLEKVEVDEGYLVPSSEDNSGDDDAWNNMSYV